MLMMLITVCNGSNVGNLYVLVWSCSVHCTCGIRCCILLTNRQHKLIGSSDCDFKSVTERSALWHGLVNYASMRRLAGKRLASSNVCNAVQGLLHNAVHSSNMHDHTQTTLVEQHLQCCAFVQQYVATVAIFNVPSCIPQQVGIPCKVLLCRCVCASLFACGCLGWIAIYTPLSP